MMEFDDVMPLFMKSNLKDIETTILANLERRKRAIAEQQNQQAELEAQLKIAKEQAEIQKISAEIQKLQSDIQTNQQKALVEERELSIKEQEVANDFQIDSMKVNLEAKQIDAASESSRQQIAASAEVKDK